MGLEEKVIQPICPPERGARDTIDLAKDTCIRITFAAPLWKSRTAHDNLVHGEGKGLLYSVCMELQSVSGNAEL